MASRCIPKRLIVSILLLMEMVLECGIRILLVLRPMSFNPSSNGNGAGIFDTKKLYLNIYTVSILLLMEMVLE